GRSDVVRHVVCNMIPAVSVREELSSLPERRFAKQEEVECDHREVPWPHASIDVVSQRSETDEYEEVHRDGGDYRGEPPSCGDQADADAHFEERHAGAQPREVFHHAGGNGEEALQKPREDTVDKAPVELMEATPEVDARHDDTTGVERHRRRGGGFPLPVVQGEGAEHEDVLIEPGLPPGLVQHADRKSVV